jgi:hypothetical protein
MSEGGLKYDGNKPRMELVPDRAIEDVAKVLTFGAAKYAAHNWRKGIDYSRLLGAALRHIHAWNRGETLDPESGLNHLAHATCDLMMILEQDYTNPERDDRYKSTVEKTQELDLNTPYPPYTDFNKE